MNPFMRRKSKYNAIPTVINGIRFASRREGARYRELLMELAAGKISDLTLQPAVKFPCGIRYVADFSYIKDGKLVREDVKGFKTPVFNLKMKCFKHHYPGEEILITK